MHPIMGIGEEVFLYAVPKRLGYFAAEGLDVDIQNSQTGMISAQVLQSNNAQVGTTAAAAIMSVREQGGDLVSFFNLKRNPGTFLVVLQGLADPEARRPQGQDHRRALVRRRRRIGLEAEPERDRHHAGAVHRRSRPAPGLRRSRRCAAGKIDALVMWDAMLGAAENTGLELRTVNIPLEDGQVGTTLATTTAFANANPKDVGGLLPRHDQGPASSRRPTGPPPSASSGRSFRPRSPPTWTTPPRSRTACTS